MDKKEVRKHIGMLKERLKTEEIEEKSALIIKKLMDTEEFRQSSNILTYVNYNQEVITTNLISQCIDLGKKVYVPKTIGREMVFHRIESLSELVPGSYGILEPDNDCDEDVDGLMVMPGLAFSRQLDRIGYGGGFYDRYLEKRAGIIRCGVAFDFQVMDDIPQDGFDIKPHMVITETQIIR